ncbi:MAG: AMP-binding protein [Planctomycetes bacterium]|nr:AMP-binding protein [Planctomycetota bacterium]
MPLYRPEWEAMAPDEREQVAIERLQAILHRVYREVPAYRERFDAARFAPEDLRGLEDFSRVPMTDRAALLDKRPYGFFTVPLREVVRLRAAPGEDALVFGFTRNDLERVRDLSARVLVAAGVTADDVVHIDLDYGLVNGAFALQDGAERIGAAVIPRSTFDPTLECRVMETYRATALLSTPSRLLHMLNALRGAAIDPKALTLRRLILGGEPCPDELRREIAGRLRLEPFEVYGLGGILGPGVAVECGEHAGLHVNEDHFLVEIIDPAAGAPVPPGGEGELVVTTLTREAFPLIRYRTGDITRIDRSPCPCGRTSVRIARIARRADDQVIIEGFSFLPGEIRQTLSRVEGTTPHFQLIVRREAMHDELELRVEVTEDLFRDEVRRLEDLRRAIRDAVARRIGVSPIVRLVEPKRLSGTAERPPLVVDLRAR